jgi:hypothetical protein
MCATSCVTESFLYYADSGCQTKAVQTMPGPPCHIASGGYTYKVLLDYTACSPVLLSNGNATLSGNSAYKGVCYHPPVSLPMTIPVAMNMDTAGIGYWEGSNYAYHIFFSSSETNIPDNFKGEVTVTPDLNPLDWF